MVNLNFIEKALKINALVIGKPEINNITGFIIDSRNISPKLLAFYECYIAVKGERYDGHDFIKECYDKGVRCFIIQKKYVNCLKKILPEAVLFPVNDTVKAMGILARSYKEALFSSIIAVTGSSGKTTTRELIVRILSRKFNVHTAKKNYNNEIGLPLTLLETPSGTHITVVELGMNHKGEIGRLSQIARPMTAVITNIGYAHIGSMGSLNAIAGAKAEIFYGLNNRGFVFLNRDDDYFDYLSRLSPAEVIDFGISDLRIIKDKALGGYRLAYNGVEFDYRMPGSHNLANLSAALKIGTFYRVDINDMIDAVCAFEPVTGRSEIIRNKIVIINDCYNANPSSMKAGLSLLSKTGGRRIAVLADMLELGKLSEPLHKTTGKFIESEKAADYVYAYGPYSKFLVDSIKNDSIKTGWFSAKEDMAEEVLKNVRDGDTVLIKGSNGMKLETIVSLLKDKFK